MSAARSERAQILRWREFSQFIVFGFVNLALTYTIYIVLILFLSYAVAYTLSYGCGILISYVLNARFVFREKLRLSKALQYPVVYLAQYLLGIALLYLLVEIAHIGASLAPLIIPVFSVPATYLFSRYVIKGSIGHRR